jgi:hypothetical protein
MEPEIEPAVAIKSRRCNARRLFLCRPAGSGGAPRVGADRPVPVETGLTSGRLEEFPSSCVNYDT